MAIKVLIGLLIVFNAGLVSAMSSSNYIIPISDCNQGGGSRASGQYRIDDVVGQGMTGGINSSNYNLSVGIITILLPQSGTSTPSATFTTNNNNCFVYPNPYKKNDTKFGGDTIWFGNVSKNAVIKVYNIAGELVKEIEVTQQPVQPWNMLNENIASGIYIYTVTGGNGGKSIGKFGIIK